MKVTIELDADPTSEKVFLTIRKAVGDQKAKTILSYPFDRETAKGLALSELEEVLSERAPKAAGVPRA